MTGEPSVMLCLVCVQSCEHNTREEERSAWDDSLHAFKTWSCLTEYLSFKRLSSSLLPASATDNWWFQHVVPTVPQHGTALRLLRYLATTQNLRHQVQRPAKGFSGFLILGGHPTGANGRNCGFGSKQVGLILSLYIQSNHEGLNLCLSDDRRCLGQYIIYGQPECLCWGRFSPHVTTVWASLGFWWQICFGMFWTSLDWIQGWGKQNSTRSQSYVQ